MIDNVHLNLKGYDKIDFNGAYNEQKMKDLEIKMKKCEEEVKAWNEGTSPIYDTDGH